ncbi:MAG: carbohydrate porin [Phycisphaerae bacterium]
MVNIPFPDYGQGIMAAIQPLDWFYVQAAIADSQADGRHTGFDTLYHGRCYTFSILELGLLPISKTPWGKLPAGYRLMLWYKPEPKPLLINTTDLLRHKTDDVGFAFNMDQMLWKENPASEDDAQGIRMFFRYGYAHDNVHLIKHFWSIGAQYRGLFPTRDDDLLGFGLVQGIIGHGSSNAGLGDRESVYELYYNIALLLWLSLTPDFQWIHQPGGTRAIPDSLVVGLRIQMSL